LTISNIPLDASNALSSGLSNILEQALEIKSSNLVLDNTSPFL